MSTGHAIVHLTMCEGTDPTYLIELIKGLQQATSTADGRATTININIQIVNKASD